MTSPPKTLLTDQDPWLTEAIAKEMPSTKHAFCIWHITAKFSGWFTSILRTNYSSWCSEFYNLYKLDTIEEFEHQWSSVIKCFNLDENKHVIGLYKIRRFWVPAYLREYFFGGMTTTGRSESINAVIKRFISSITCLNQFVRQVELAIKDMEQTQAHDSMKQKYKGSRLKSHSPLEEQGHRFLTPYAFEKFQGEFELATQYKVHEMASNKFIVKHYKEIWGNMHHVDSNGSVAKCSCKNFEFVGILCRHILSVFLHKECFNIPFSYWLSRWSREEVLPSNDIANLNSTSINHNESVINAIGVVRCPPTSKPKGRPKEKRLKGGRELMKQVRSCSLCKCVGHNATTCSEREEPENEDANSVRAMKKKKIILENQDLNHVFSLKF